MENYLLNLQKGDYISARRPRYNGSNEIVVDNKKIRPYIVLEVYEDMILAVAVTSNPNNHHNFEIGPWNYARVNDLYLIPKSDIQNIYNNKALSPKIFEELMAQIEYFIDKKDILYNKKIKLLFHKALFKMIKEKSYKMMVESGKKYEVGDVVYRYHMPNKKYVIDQVVSDGYLAYRVNQDERGNVIDFESTIKLIKDEVYCLSFKVDLSLYQQEKDIFIKNKYRKNTDRVVSGNNRKIVLDTGDIVRFNQKKYLVICRDKDYKNIVAIPYDSNYIFEKIVKIPLSDCRRVKMNLSNEELVLILKKVLMNIDVSRKEYFQNIISMKIKKL